MHCMENEDIPELLGYLEHQDIDMRWSAAVLLCRKGAAAVDPLLKKVYHHDDNVRVLAIWALGRIGDKRAGEPIARMLDDENEIIRLASEGALSRLTGSY